MSTELSPPVPQTPTEDTVMDPQAATFSWTSVEGADTYELQISRDEAFEQPLLTLDVGTATAYTVTGVLDVSDQTHYWRVRAQAGETQSAYSEATRFVPSGVPASASMEVDAGTAQPLYVEGVDVAVEPEGFASGSIFLWMGAILVVVAVLSIALVQLSDKQKRAVTTEWATNAPYPELRETEATAREKLTQYQLLDQSAGQYQIPIDRAMDLMVNDARQNRRSDYSAELQLLPSN